MNRHIVAITTATALVTLGGCAATTTPETDARFGESMTMLRAQQVIDPTASANTDPVTGIDGYAAKGAFDKYRKSFGNEKSAEARGPTTLINNSVGN